MSVCVRRPGLFTTVQDSGRWGYQHVGVPVAGAMDMASHRLANAIVGNEPSAATLEITLVGPELECDRATLFAVTGAEFDVRLDGVDVAANTSCLARSGQVIAFGRRRSGARGYLSVQGGVDVPFVLGSRSTHVASRMGGFTGRALQAGDSLDVAAGAGRFVPEGTRRAPVFRMPRDGARVRVIVEPHTKILDPPRLHAFERARYWVAPESDRMGYRLKGERLRLPDDVSVISSAVSIGSIQIPSAGFPIVLMADHQTTGGYPRAATVISADLPVVAQLKASDWIEFESCSPSEAVRALITQERALMAVSE